MIDSPSKKDVSSQKHEIRPTQSIELLKELHILTRDGKLNQDTRRKLKQVYHLVQFIEPLLQEVLNRKDHLSIVDHGAGKSYLGFILNDLFCKIQESFVSQRDKSLNLNQTFHIQNGIWKSLLMMSQRLR